MKEEEINKEISIVKLGNEKLAAKKLECEIQQLNDLLNIPFYRSAEFMRPLVTGLSLALIFAAYIQYIFIPTQYKLNLEIDTAEFTIQQNSVRHTVQLAKLDLIHEQIKQDAKTSQAQLDSATIKLQEALKQNISLQSQIAKLSVGRVKNVRLKEMNIEIKRSENEINKQIASIQDTSLSIDSSQEFIIENKQDKGWIYIGYFPNNEWNYKNIEIPNEMPITGNVYKVINNVNIRSSAPERSWFKYKFGRLIGYLVTNKSIRIISTEVIGNNKVWALVETIDA